MESDNPSDKEDVKQIEDNLSDVKKNEENIKNSDNEGEIKNKSDAECSDDDIAEDIDWDNMTAEKAYEILAKKYPIPYTDWNDPKDVEREDKRLRMEPIGTNMLGYTLSFEKWYSRCLSVGQKYPSVTLTEREYWKGYKAIKDALNMDYNMDPPNSLCLNVILVHMPFVLKSSITDATLVDKNNLPHNLCYETALKYVRYFLLKESPKAGLLSSVGNEHWSQRVKKLYDIIINDFADFVCGIYGWD